MRLVAGVHLVMSGGAGFDLTEAFDCNAYLFDAGNGERVLFDAGAGRDPAALDAVLAEDGVAPASIAHLFLTHGHADHSGGARGLRDRLGLRVHAGAATASMVAAGDEAAISLDRARAAGIYPADYRYRACPVDDIAVPAAPIRIGGLTVTAIATPGHSADHLSFLVERDGRRFLVAGDALFYGGKVAVQDIPDCSIAQICATVRTLAAIPFDALLPGHLNFTLRGADRHAAQAMTYVQRFQCPPSII
jgi:glyoxylase-like metal-dependent hydrolase (beta-lactamase superfamily II)